MDVVADPSTVLASSTSNITASKFTATLKHRHRCLVAHPVDCVSSIARSNALCCLYNVWFRWIHLIWFLLLRLYPHPGQPKTSLTEHETYWTVLDKHQSFFWKNATGLCWIVCSMHFLAKRFGMLANDPHTTSESILIVKFNSLIVVLFLLRLVEDGICSPEDVDTAVSHGLGMRWSFMGPFQTIDLNAPNGTQNPLMPIQQWEWNKDWFVCMYVRYWRSCWLLSTIFGRNLQCVKGGRQ